MAEPHETFDPAPTSQPEDVPSESIDEDLIQFGLEEEYLSLVLPAVATQEIQDWEPVWAQLEAQLADAPRLPLAQVHLWAKDQLLGGPQFAAITNRLRPHDLILKRIYTHRRQTAIAAVTAGYNVEQQAATPLLEDAPHPLLPFEAPAKTPEALYLDQTIRSGVEISHPGSVIVIGDVNAGGAIIADKDIVIWGCLRGMAHAGRQGDRTARIMALQMNPTQLRIAEAVARSGQLIEHAQPEVAYLTEAGIHLAPALKFAQNYHYQSDREHWQEAPNPLNL